MIKSLKVALVLSAFAASLISCANSNKKCIYGEGTVALSEFQFPENVTSEELGKICDSLNEEALKYVNDEGTLSSKQILCEGHAATVKEKIANCFRCNKLIWKEANAHIQMCKECKKYLTDIIEDQMVEIPAKTDSNGALEDFCVSRFETTQELFKLVTGENPSSRTGNRKPVECVKESDINTFLAKLSDITGETYRLLTDKEFDFLTKDIRWGNSQDTLNTISWNYDNAGETTHDVGTTKYTTKYGLYDMIGNVWELTSSTDNNGEAVIRRRGGGFNNTHSKLFASYEAITSDENFADKGFRIAKDGAKIDRSEDNE